MDSLTVVLPTLNEEKNIPVIYEKLLDVLKAYDWEIIFVDDDSKDNTLAVIDGISRKDRRVRRIHRINRTGLSSACIEGILASNSDYVAVMDADLQHDETLLPKMVYALSEENFDMVIGSRYIKGGDVGEWDNNRQKISLFATRFAQRIFRLKVTDPMSGFFMFNREKIVSTLKKTNGRGFKILFDILSTNPKLKTKEIPFSFKNRTAGASKLNLSVIFDFYISVLCVLLRRKFPPEFISFVNVGAIGVCIHGIVLLIMMNLGIEFIYSQSIAAFTAMNSNFFINNVTTHRSRKIPKEKIFGALILFYLLCSFGLLYNLIVATHFFKLSALWLVAGIMGSFLSAVWNYATTSVFVWKSLK